MPTIYIAGPMRGYPDFNFPAFDAAKNLLRSKGWDVISPADMDRENGDSEATVGPLPVNGGAPELIRKFVQRDVKALLSLRAEKGDAVYVLNGVERSVGAKAEVHLALWLKLRIIYENPGSVYEL